MAKPSADEKLYLVVRDGIYYVHGTINGKRIRRSCETRSAEKAQLYLDSVLRDVTSGWRSNHDDADTTWKVVVARVYERHRRSASVRNMTFDLEPSDVYAMMKATGFRCAVSGVPFVKDANAPRDPWAASIDRIENRQGYTRDNVRVVCLAANIAMSNWGHDVLLRLARGVVNSSERVSLEPEVARSEHRHIAESAQVIEFIKET